ncbi:Desumoylating isopeptidase 1 [Escovopsis weberi]|uniref:Desumoylating isopeptidase 1 n=1 Tax=Escovopsis weberi TaxID=150374 RepID=A0A0M8N762_ESCWE|nr:Desumoylating isopeptidase 1 [Escovopsis weberi]
MDVHLLVYDLSRGLARQMSMNLLGFQLDAIYHTSIELQGREYVYDGGIIAIAPGSSHLGQPMERLHLGITSLPMDVIEDYLESIRPIFTLEAYDLFRHNCNNFTDSFSEFLLGKGIPRHIANMPQAVMDSPFGRMMLPQLTQMTNGSRQNGSILGLEQSAQSSRAPATASRVRTPKSAADYLSLLEQAKGSCAVVFLTSATCPPCKTLYPLYERLAEEFEGRATLIKVDVSQAQGMTIGSQYHISATPTFITFLKGEQENRWSGADLAGLRGNVELLVQMANPVHFHKTLRLPTFSNPNVKPVLFGKVPPLPKLVAKLGDGVANAPEVQELKAFIETRSERAPIDAVLPNMGKLAQYVRDSTSKLPPEVLFAIVDLLRCALVDPRVSGYFAEEAGHETVLGVLRFVNQQSSCPYALRLVTLHMACNLFSSTLFPSEILGKDELRKPIIQLITTSFLDHDRTNLRVAASCLFFNVALSNRAGIGSASATATLPEDDQVELAASVVEAIAREETSAEALQGMLSALGQLVYCVDLESELADLLRTLDASDTVFSKKKSFPDEKLVAEVGSELLGKGLRRR